MSSSDPLHRKIIERKSEVAVRDFELGIKVVLKVDFF